MEAHRSQTGMGLSQVFRFCALWLTQLIGLRQRFWDGFILNGSCRLRSHKFGFEETSTCSRLTIVDVCDQLIYGHSPDRDLIHTVMDKGALLLSRG